MEMQRNETSPTPRPEAQRIFLKSRDLTYISCNVPYAQDLGIAPYAIAGKNDYDFHPPELANQYRDDDKIVIETGQGKDVIEPYRLDGQERWIHTIKLPVWDEKGNINGVLGTFWDITHTRKMELDLIQLQQAIEQSMDGMAVADMEGRVTFANSAWLNMHGYTREEVLGQSLALFHTPEQLEKEVLPFNEQVRQKGV